MMCVAPPQGSGIRFVTQRRVRKQVLRLVQVVLTHMRVTVKTQDNVHDDNPTKLLSERYFVKYKTVSKQL